VNDRDQPVAILPDIEDYVSVHIIGIFENLPHLNEVSPSRLGRNPKPRPDLSGCFRILIFGLDQVLACDYVHKGFPKMFRPETFGTPAATLPRYFAKCKVVKRAGNHLSLRATFHR
jgi:hypothetical protein